MAEEKAMPPRSSFSICLSIFSFSREGSKATLVLVCPIFFEYPFSKLRAKAIRRPVRTAQAQSSAVKFVATPILAA